MGPQISGMRLPFDKTTYPKSTDKKLSARLPAKSWQLSLFLRTSRRMHSPTPMPEKNALAIRAFRPVVTALLILPIVLFIPAHTLKFWQAWAFIAVTVGAGLCITVYYLRRDPEALARRLFRREPLGAHRVIISVIKVVYVCTMILAAMDFGNGWTRGRFGIVPWWISAAALLVIAGADILFVKVLAANRFAASVIQVESGQTIAATGPYRLIRHPMYAGATIRWLATPLALGSLITIPAFLIIPILVARLLLEENFLGRELPGYPEYCRQTPWRLIPFVW
jgi:protein-S-isoprenylcysteine O-methyltransferase Ste14